MSTSTTLVRLFPASSRFCPEYGLMHSNIVTPDTVAYHLAVEAGAIKEVQ